ncbi:hypothetical protein [Lactobacillus sp. CBA3606]|nr:hypothetical protein [Lactobacillus sp. CBA3606]
MKARLFAKIIETILAADYKTVVTAAKSQDGSVNAKSAVMRCLRMTADSD